MKKLSPATTLISIIVIALIMYASGYYSGMSMKGCGRKNTAMLREMLINNGKAQGFNIIGDLSASFA